MVEVIPISTGRKRDLQMPPIPVLCALRTHEAHSSLPSGPREMAVAALSPPSVPSNRGDQKPECYIFGGSVVSSLISRIAWVDFSPKLKTDLIIQSPPPPKTLQAKIG